MLPAVLTAPSAPETPRPRRRGLAVVVLGLVATLAAIAFPFAPVIQPQVTYAWDASDGPAAIPLMPYQPVQLTATIGCGALRDGLVLDTVPPRPDPAAQPLSGLQVRATGGTLEITSAGVELGAVASCPVTIASDPQRTVVTAAGRTVLTLEGDVRPDVAGAFTDARSGVGLTLTADTRFQTTISPLKAAVAGICVLALLGMLVALRRDGGPVRRTPRSRRHRRRLLAADLAVTALLAVWWVVGSLTVDDGYISGIVRSRGENGFIGNVYRWLNAPEAPFSWFYDLFHLWSGVSDSTLWMRLPSTLLGLLCWVLLSRGVLPRLRTPRPWLAALAFATWWIPYNLGLRPEPWVAVGVLATYLAVERAVATRRALPLTAGLLLAGVTTALTPGGLIAFMPFLAALAPLLRIVRADPLPVTVACVAAPSAAVLLMVSDQSLAAMLEGTRVRTLIGGGLEWFQEYERYANLLEPGSFQASIGKRAAVLFTLLAAAGLLVALRRNRAGIATGPAMRLVAGFGLGLVAMTFTPTKWTQHFGDLAGTGAAVLMLGLVAFAGGPLRARGRGSVAALAAVTGVGALALAANNVWPYASNWFTPTFSTIPPEIAGVRVSVLVLAAGGLLVAGLVGRTAWSGARAVPRWVPAPAPVVAVMLAAVLLLQVGGLVRTAAEHPGGYTLASDAVATVRGEPCGLQRLLSVETDPAAGLLPARPGPVAPAIRPVDIGGRSLPGLAVAGRSTTAWFTLDPAQRDGRLPVVVTASGVTGPADTLAVQFARGAQIVGERRVTSTSSGPIDVRLMAPSGADTIRLNVDAPTQATRPPALVSLPRVPRLTPMETLLPPGSTAVLDWPVAFLFGCITPEPLALGSAGLARWRVAPPATDPSAGITYAPRFGGPFAAPRLLVTEQRMATYLADDPTRDAAQLFRWVPITDLAAPQPVVTDQTVMGGHATGRARVPGLDTPG